MPINFFRTIRSTLDQTLDAYCSAKNIPRPTALAMAKSFVLRNSAAYYSPNPQLDYHDPFCRIAYLFAYVASHAELVVRAFDRFNRLSRRVEECFSNEQPYKICSLGGGPGSEMLGFAKYVERVANGRRLNVEFTLIDSVGEWDETWDALRRDLYGQFRETYGSETNWPLNITHSFLERDLTNVTSFDHFVTRFRNINLFIGNFTVSELINEIDAFSNVLRMLSKRTSPNADFLFIDRTESRVKSNLQMAMDYADLWLLDEFDLQGYMEFDEDKSVLGEWLSALDRTPKIKVNSFHILAAPSPF